jgi:hypothetical protein
MLTIAQFRNDFPAFADTTVYPDSALTFWLNVAVLMLNVGRWGAMYNLGLELYMAYNLLVESQNQIVVAIGGQPGIVRGPIASETPGSVSLSYDTNAGLDKDAGIWNMNNYGTRFYHLMRIMGAGPVLVNAGCADGLAFGGAWPGVLNGVPGYGTD